MARSFNGSSQYLLGAAPVTAYPWSLSIWFLPNNVTSELVMFSLGKSTGETANLWDIRVEGTRAEDPASIYSFPGTRIARTANSVIAGQWNHVAVIATAANARSVVLNGDWSNGGFDSASSTPSGVDTVSIGCQWYNTAAYAHFAGRLSFAALWNAAIVQDEVESLGQTLNGVPCGVHPTRIRPESLVACWPLGGFDGDHDGDIWANAYNLTPYNSPTWDESPAVLYSAGPLWLPAFTISSSDRTAAISGTMGAMSASLAAGFTKPTYTSSIAGTHGPMAAAMSASRTLPTDTASIAASHAAMVASLAASFTKPVDTAAITATNAPMSAALSASFAKPTYSATIVATHAPMAASLGAAFGDPEFTASIAASHAPMSAAVSATFDEPTYTASIAGTLGAMTSTVSAASATEIDTASIVATMGAMTASLTAVYSDIIYVTTDCGIVPHFTRSTVPRFRRRNMVAGIRRNTVPRFRRARR